MIFTQPLIAKISYSLKNIAKYRIVVLCIWPNTLLLPVVHT